MRNIYGTIGYTLLEHKNGKNKIIVLADMHNTLPKCDNKINMAEWFKSKFNKSEIFLEEVPRENFKLKELWTESEHTQELKNLYLNNMKMINALDIRPFMIPFSWEVVDSSDNYKITLKRYMKLINEFFCIREPYLKSKLSNYNKEKLTNTLVGKHFLKLKKEFYNFVKNNRKLLQTMIYDIKNSNIMILEEINTMLNSIMEWYICAKIELKKHRPIIIHAGLYHSDKVINWLSTLYSYNIIKQQGINTMKESTTKPINGCINLDPISESSF